MPIEIKRAKQDQPIDASATVGISEERKKELESAFDAAVKEALGEDQLAWDRASFSRGRMMA